VLRIRPEIVACQKDGFNSRVPVLHFVPEGEAIHGLHEDLGDEDIDLLAFHEIERLLPGGGKEDFVALRVPKDIRGHPQFLLLVHDENLHRLIACPAA
jgi:hypothetical protein